MSTPADVQQTFEGMPQRRYSASPSRLLTWLDCPRHYRFAYLDRPRPATRPQRAHTSVGLSVHNALRDLWDVAAPRRSPSVGAGLVRERWIDVGFRDAAQSQSWRERSAAEVSSYLEGGDATRQPVGVERTVALRRPTLVVAGRVDRLDERPSPDGRTELVVVDYKTSRRTPTVEDARTSLPLALYAASAWKMFRRRCVRVELHHVPTRTVLAHEHTVESLQRKISEAESIAADLRRADADYAEHGAQSALFEPRLSPLCTWCDFRAHCPEGQAVGPEQSSWAALEDLRSSDAANRL